MSNLPLLTRDQLDPVLLTCEYLRVCATFGLPVGSSLAELADHAWRQGAQFRELTPVPSSELFRYLNRSVS